MKNKWLMYFKHPISVILVSLLISQLCVYSIRSFNQSFVLMQTNFHLVESTPKEMVYNDNKGNPLVISVSGYDTFASALTQEYRMTYQDKTYLRVLNLDQFEVHYYVDEVLVKTDPWVIISGQATYLGQDPQAAPPTEEDYFDAIPKAIHHYTIRSDFHYFFYFLITLFFSGLGLVFIHYPEELWAWKTMFIVKNGQPTDFYLWTTQASGVLFVLVGTFFSVYMYLRI